VWLAGSDCSTSIWVEVHIVFKEVSDFSFVIAFIFSLSCEGVSFSFIDWGEVILSFRKVSDFSDCDRTGLSCEGISTFFFD